VTRPVLAVEITDKNGEKRRLYRHPKTGELVPSVTTVLKQINKPKLVGWSAKMAAQHAVANWTSLSQMPIAQRMSEIQFAHERYSKKAAGTGDIVHELVDAWSTGRPFPEWPKEVNGFANQFISFLMDKKPKFIENEVTCWSRTHSFAGTADFIVEIGGVTYMADLKSGKSLWPEVGMQTAALAGADFIIRETGEESPLPHINGTAALHVRPRSWKFQPLSGQAESFGAFLAARELLRWETDTAPNVLGEATWTRKSSSSS
jgi:hypothetical protein